MTSSSFVTPTFPSSYGYVVAYTYSNSKSNEWGKVCVLVNSGTQAYTISNLGASSWVVVANGSKAGLTSLGTVSGSSYSIPARSSAILVESSTFSRLQNAQPQYGTLKINHVDESGNVIKTANAKYPAGATYRAAPDAGIMFDHNLISTTGATTGTVEANKTYTVTFTYSSTGLRTGYLNVKYVDQNGNSVKESSSERYKEGQSYNVPAPVIQGYQLDTDKFPAATIGTFAGTDKTITFTYKPLDNASTVVHYYNSYGWNSVRCYAYTDSGEEPNGEWAKATIMTNDGNSWFSCTVPATSAYVMFYPRVAKAGTPSQEPGQGDSGYPVAGEAWIQNKIVTFNSKVVTSHIDLATGKKLSADVVDEKTKVTSSSTYTTSQLSGRTDVIVPGNAYGNNAAGITNVVYLYGDTSVTPTNPQPTTQAPQPTTVAPQPTTQAPQPTTAEPVGDIMIGDTTLNKKVSIEDATAIQKYLVKLTSLSANAQLAADADESGTLDIKDATLIQRYVSGAAAGNVGKLIQSAPQPTTAAPQPTTQAPQPTTQAPQPTTAPPVVNNVVTFSNSRHWSGTISCYYWSDENPTMVEWPGVAMTKSYTNDYGEDVYTIEVPSNATGLIFTNGSSQTVDISYSGGEAKYYATATQDGYGNYGVAEW